MVNSFSRQNNEEVTPEAMAELEMKYFPQESPLGLFRLCKVYMDSCLVIGDQSTVSRKIFTSRFSFQRFKIILERRKIGEFLELTSDNTI